MNLKRNFYNIFFQNLCVFILLVIVILPFYGNTQNIDSLKFVIKKSTSKIEKAQIYNELSNLYLEINLDSSRFFVDEALVLAKELNNFNVLSNAYVNYANAFYFAGNLDSTLFYYQKSYSEIIKTADQNEIAASLNRLGLIYEAKSNYSEATKYYYQALKIYEESKHKPGLANVYNNLGIINDAFGRNEKAIIDYKSALDLFLEINDLDGQANVYNNLATLYSEIDDLEKAISYINTSIQISKNINGKSSTGAAYLNASTLYEKKGLSDSAHEMLDSALVYYQFSNNLHGIANVLDKEAAYFTESQNNQKAVDLLLQSIILREKVGSLNATSITLKQLSETFQSLGDYEKAFAYYQRYVVLKDSIFSESTNKVISELNIKYETAEKNKAISLLKKESEIKQFQNKLLFILSITFAMGTILLLYLFRTKSKLLKSQKEAIQQKEALSNLEREKQQTEKLLLEKEIKAQQEINELQKIKFNNELEHSKRELATSTMQILNKNKILVDIKESIRKLKSSKNDEKDVLANISTKVNSSINLDEDWEQFKIHFEKVNTSFFEKLQNNHPKLTTGDLKVCAYVKINLSSKEIAQMMNISSHGIDKRLYRIRKKMDLSPSNSLSTYLSEY